MNQQNSTTPTLVIAETPIRHDVAGRYCLNDLHRAAGGESRHQPAFFIRRNETEELVAELINSANSQGFDSVGRGASANSQTPPLVTVNDGFANGTYAVKELVYAYAMWISARFHLEVIRAYDRLVTGQAAEPDPAGPPIGVFTVIEAVETARHPEGRAALHGLLAAHCRAHGLYVPVLARADGRAPRLNAERAALLRRWFWEAVKMLGLAGCQANHARGGSVEAYSIKQVRRLVADMALTVPEGRELAEALRGDARFVRVATVNSGLTHTSVKCWLFRPAASAAPALVH